MKIKILKPCTTPAGNHQPGDTIDAESRHAEYLIANGFAKAAGGKQETASDPMQGAESAMVATPKAARSKGR